MPWQVIFIVIYDRAKKFHKEVEVGALDFTLGERIFYGERSLNAFRCVREGQALRMTAR